MLDINFIRENQELIRDAARKKHIKFDIAKLIEEDDKRRSLLQGVEEIRAQQNAAGEEIAKAKDGDREALVRSMKGLKETLQKKEEELEKVMKAWRLLMLQVPNVPDVSVPEGEDDSKNQEIKAWGLQPQFAFTPKSHIELMTALDMADFERGAKVSGFRGYFLKNDGARLAFALWRFAQDFFLESSKGFTPIITPSIVRPEPFFGTGYLPQGEEDLYKTQDGAYLTGTSEVPIMGYHMDEVIPKEKFPIKFFGFSSCFRREAGSHGKDTKGIVRVHEFFKFEQVILCEADHQTSVKYHEWINRNTEEAMEKLGIPYHTVINAGGDLGLGQVKKYDIELWVPSEKRYREISSASYFHDFQTRRLNIRYRGEDGKLRFAHSLNSTAIATPRLLVPLIENNQEADGSIVIPKALQPYMGKERITKDR
ncbi:MAG: serine--tRNA ligase [Parcubacteria group bacterium]|nr:serine--tRNA ligase [Parcubacteria group bacterium]